MRNILWLASWYPDSQDPYDGDFIQRHAKALATQTSVYVVSVKPHRGMRANEFHQNHALTEDIRFYRHSNVPLFGRLINMIQFLSTGISAINDFQRQHGKPDLIHVHVLMKAGLLAWWMKAFHGIPFVVTEHYNIYHEARPDSFFNRSWVYRYAVRKILTASSGIVSVSQYIATQLQQIAPNLKSVWVPNTVDTRLFHQSVSHNDRFVFIHASTMHPVKNIDGILEAIKQLSEKRSDFEVKLFGLNPHGVEEKINALQIEKFVSLNGKVTYNRVAEETRSADAQLMFSRWENMPCSILEALCCGLPIVATRVGGIPEVVNESNGILVNDNNVNGLVEAMARAIGNRSRFNKEQIAAAASGQFSFESIGKKILQAYKSHRYPALPGQRPKANG